MVVLLGVENLGVFNEMGSDAPSLHAVLGQLQVVGIIWIGQSFFSTFVVEIEGV